MAAGGERSERGAFLSVARPGRQCCGKAATLTLFAPIILRREVEVFFRSGRKRLFVRRLFQTRRVRDAPANRRTFFPCFRGCSRNERDRRSARGVFRQFRRDAKHHARAVSRAIGQRKVARDTGSEGQRAQSERSADNAEEICSPQAP
jgi:hypothetical protein